MIENGTPSEVCEKCGKSGVRKRHRICDICYKANCLHFAELDKKKTQFNPEIDKITDKVYLGNYDGQRDKQKLNDIGITSVLICGNYFQRFYPNEYIYYELEIDDTTSQNIIDYFDDTFLFIERSYKVFVHCGSGVSRSPSFVIAYLMKKNDWRYEEAYKFVEDKRRIIDPNPNFIDQLKLYEKKLFGN